LLNETPNIVLSRQKMIRVAPSGTTSPRPSHNQIQITSAARLLFMHYYVSMLKYAKFMSRKTNNKAPLYFYFIKKD
jgi:hypothetical protein